MVYIFEGGEFQEIEVYKFQGGGGVVQIQYNIDEFIIGFVYVFFKFVIDKGFFLYMSIKNIIFKKYDGCFKDIFQEFYDIQYKEVFEVKGIWYEYCFIDDMVVQMIKSSGGYIMVFKSEFWQLLGF